MSKLNKSKFKLPIISILLLAFCTLAIYFYSPTQAQNPNTIVLKSGTPVALRLTEEVSTKTKNVGDVVHFEVVGDITVGRNIVIKGGAPAEGEVTIAEKAEILGKPEKLAFIARSVQAIDSTKVPLRATLTREGQSKETKSLALGLFLCFLFIFEKGGKAEFPAGTEVKAYVDYDTEVTISPAR